jgi:hypothetical protein
MTENENRETEKEELQILKAKSIEELGLADPDESEIY